MDAKTFASLLDPPTLDQIDLVLLIDYYEAYLAPYIYEFELENGDIIELKFNVDNFCHLIGIHKPAEKKFGGNSYKVYNYKGSKGYRRIKNGEITKITLKNLNKSAYKAMRDKMVYFYLIHRLLETPKAVFYTRPINNVKAVDIFFYEKNEKVFMHLGIIKHSKQNFFVPSTVIVERITEYSKGDKYINGQTPVAITKILKTKDGIEVSG
ncbi:PBECR4 domain-containing protein [Sporosarcina luteola]|uniref:PBECR4 domain-containing protein n=1 Tax=Sporosarcina luteola TaxID=582850 RepID=UPI00203F4F30|nr:PBECR4 domain-containing protein [Sporosarcina luteola]MCM3636361.1 PBECR4 domain-containing protein [Sporosarcina luteola]